HQGYHYPRNVRTGLSCVANFPRFVRDHRDAIVDGFEKLYAIARRNSLVTASQFVSFCKTVGAPVRPAGEAARKLFDRDLIEEVFEVREVAFDANALRQRLARDVEAAGIILRLSTKVTRLEGADRGEIVIHTATGARHRADRVFVCTYSRINTILRDS